MQTLNTLITYKKPTFVSDDHPEKKLLSLIKLIIAAVSPQGEIISMLSNTCPRPAKLHTFT